MEMVYMISKVICILFWVCYLQLCYLGNDFNAYVIGNLHNHILLLRTMEERFDWGHTECLSREEGKLQQSDHIYEGKLFEGMVWGLTDKARQSNGCGVNLGMSNGNRSPETRESGKGDRIVLDWTKIKQGPLLPIVSELIPHSKVALYTLKSCSWTVEARTNLQRKGPEMENWNKKATNEEIGRNRAKERRQSSRGVKQMRWSLRLANRRWKSLEGISSNEHPIIISSGSDTDDMEGKDEAFDKLETVRVESDGVGIWLGEGEGGRISGHGLVKTNPKVEGKVQSPDVGDQNQVDEDRAGCSEGTQDSGSISGLATWGVGSDPIN